MKRKDHYATLGIERGAAPEQIRAAFRGLVKKYHPDQAGEETTQQFREIREAYEVLSDPERRRSYDRDSGGMKIEIHRGPPPKEYRRRNQDIFDELMNEFFGKPRR